MTRLYYNDINDTKLQNAVKDLNERFFLLYLAYNSYYELTKAENQVLTEFNKKWNTNFTYFSPDFYNNFNGIWFEVAN